MEVSKKKKVVVLDLDETLVFSSFKICELEGCNHFTFFSGGYHFCVHPRPGLTEFLDWLDSKEYLIVIFSAAVRSYVDRMVENIFEDRKNKPIHSLDSSFYFYTKKTSTIKELFPEEEILIAAVDDCKSNFINDPQVIYITPWYNTEPEDNQLALIKPCIEQLLR